MIDYRIRNKKAAFRFVEQCDMVTQLIIAVSRLKADVTSLHFDYRELKKRLAATDLNHLNIQIKADLNDIKDCIKHRSEQLTRLKKLLKKAQRGVTYSLTETSEQNCYPYAKVHRTIYKAGAFMTKSGDFELTYGGGKRHRRKKHPIVRG